jgi:hypothetical protein
MHIRVGMNDLPPSATIPLIFIFYFFYDIAYTPLLVSYTLEILPYRIRAKGYAVMVREEIHYHNTYALTCLAPQNVAAMLTAAFNQFINPVAIKAIGWWYYISYCAWLVIELVFVVTSIVETKGIVDQLPLPLYDTNWLSGRTLEETAALFDGDEQPRDLIAMGGDAATQTMTNRHLRVIDRERRYSQKGTVELYELKSRPQYNSQSGDFVLTEVVSDLKPRAW